MKGTQDDDAHHAARIALGARLKGWRLRGNFKIAEAAGQLGVSTATWGHWETGRHLPSTDLLLALERLTGIPLHVLFCPHLDTCRLLRADADCGPDQRCCGLHPTATQPTEGD